MTEDRNNIIFVQIVEKYPCIYDYTSKGYSKRETAEKAWLNIAQEVNDTVPNCKEKWKNLRTAFARSLKKQSSCSASKRNKEYYLKDVMQFVLPFMKLKRRIGTLPSQDFDMKFECGESVASDSLVREADGNMPTSASSDATSFDVKPPVKTQRDEFGPLDADKCFIDYINAKKEIAKRQDANSDLDFLKSLLPDISKMNDYQKRLFKRRTLETIDSILCDGPSSGDVSSPSSIVTVKPSYPRSDVQ